MEEYPKTATINYSMAQVGSRGCKGMVGGCDWKK